MADSEQDSEEGDEKLKAPCVGSPCDELDMAEIFEGSKHSNVEFEVGDHCDFGSDRQSSFEKASDAESASSELEDLYLAELGVTPPRNLQRVRDRIKTRRRGQEKIAQPPKVILGRTENEKRRRERGSNQTQLKTERAFQRQFKRNSFGDFESNGNQCGKPLDVPSMKIESRNRYMSLKCTRRDTGGNLCGETPGKTRLTRSESDPRSLGFLSSHMPQSRTDFYRTFSLLIKIGAHAHKQRDSQFAVSELERQNSEEHKKWQVELKLALWLELRAWHAGCSMEEQDQFLIDERQHVDDVLEEVINFNFNNLDKESDAGGKQPFSVKDKEGDNPPLENKVVSPYPTITVSCEGNSTIDIKEYCEPSTSGDSTNTERPESLDFNLKRTHKIVKQPSTNESSPMAEQEKFNAELKAAILKVTELFEKLEAAEHLYPNLKSVGECHPRYSSPDFHRNVDALQLWLNVANDLLHKLQLTARFLGVDHQETNVWQDWYRPFVDRSIKKFGLIKLGKRIGDILDTSLLKAKQVLIPEGASYHHDNATEWITNDWESNISHLESILYRDVATEMRPRSQSQVALSHVSIEQNSYGVPWSTEFRNLGLPSFSRLFLFMARIPLDISHECIRLRLEHRPKGDPSDLSVRQLLRECKEVILGAVLVKDYYLYMVDGMVTPEDLDHERLENDIEEFEQDLQSMLKVAILGSNFVVFFGVKPRKIRKNP
ncbi:predicted protein [Nematostella vectensis]|uniref:Mitogen-activated protein kinase kinase kinase N-terminal domain-containing protein n=1 Tax=Nematostella vectensis TaxID=45351 RepID=A7T0A4_NEMVE|nr:predicted protein [Nematostella vectensis]|eukprot:XP_001622710.1 predicted protein [Nematostella vectensis]